MNKQQLTKLSVEEKALLTSGRGAWHTHAVGDLPEIMMTDGPHGLRKQSDAPKGINDSNVATCFPTSCAVASSWNVQNAAEIARCIAEEAIAEDVYVVLGPGVNIKEVLFAVEISSTIPRTRFWQAKWLPPTFLPCSSRV